MKDESIEFELNSAEKESAEPVRQFFRVPVSDKESIQVLIKQKKYSVTDISLGGVRISPDNPFDPESGEILPDCELILTQARLSGLTGKVIHRSSSEFGPSQYGIQWLDIKISQRETLDEIILQMKNRALGNNDLDVTNTNDLDATNTKEVEK
jgi:c-di-GMP-binding flagellar brake protein YcgR